MPAKKKPVVTGSTVATNRRARFDYFIDETLEAGLILTGSEVKSLRQGRASINECYAAPGNDELWLINAYIAEYTHAGRSTNHAPRRNRKLLIHRREYNRLLGQTKREGVTLVPMSIYFNRRGLAKVQLGVARGKKKVDKREAIKAREWARQKSRVVREAG